MSASMMVPSFCVRNKGHVNPSDRIASLKPRIVDCANFRMDMSRMVAFSRSRYPSWPTAVQIGEYFRRQGRSW
jgi:hypothetical protein